MFVYDTECCQDEADDPVDAVLYFHPNWVSDTQKLSLCGQLMGTFHFLRESFGKPKVIALQNGKFVIKEFGRFVLVCIGHCSVVLLILGRPLISLSLFTQTFKMCVFFFIFIIDRLLEPTET